MANSTCAKCGGHNFEIKLFEPAGGRYKQNFIQCSKCGVPVGVVGYYDTGAKLEKLEGMHNLLSNGIGELADRLSMIERLLGK